MWEANLIQRDMEMHKKRVALFAAVVAAVAVVLAGCSMGAQAFNPSVLEPTQEIPEEMKGKMPVSYQAVTVDVANKALPFSLKLPKELPFEADDPVVLITDMDGQGERIVAEVLYVPAGGDRSATVIIEEANFARVLGEETQAHPPFAEEVQLDNGETAYLQETNPQVMSLAFAGKGMEYVIRYQHGGAEHVQEALLLIANSMK